MIMYGIDYKPAKNAGSSKRRIEAANGGWEGVGKGGSGGRSFGLGAGELGRGRGWAGEEKGAGVQEKKQEGEKWKEDAGNDKQSCGEADQLLDERSSLLRVSLHDDCISHPQTVVGDGRVEFSAVRQFQHLALVPVVPRHSHLVPVPHRQDASGVGEQTGGGGAGQVGLEPAGHDGVEGGDVLVAVEGGSLSEIGGQEVEPVRDVDGRVHDGLPDERIVGRAHRDGVGQHVAAGGQELVDGLVGLLREGARVLQVHGGDLESGGLVLVAGDGGVETLLVVLDFGVDLLLAEELGVEDGSRVGEGLREDVEGGTAAGELRLQVGVGSLLLGELGVEGGDLVGLVFALVGRLGQGVLSQHQVGTQSGQVLLQLLSLGLAAAEVLADLGEVVGGGADLDLEVGLLVLEDGDVVLRSLQQSARLSQLPHQVFHRRLPRHHVLVRQFQLLPRQTRLQVQDVDALVRLHQVAVQRVALLPVVQDGGRGAVDLRVDAHDGLLDLLGVRPAEVLLAEEGGLAVLDGADAGEGGGDLVVDVGEEGLEVGDGGLDLGLVLDGHVEVVVDLLLALLVGLVVARDVDDELVGEVLVGGQLLDHTVVAGHVLRGQLLLQEDGLRLRGGDPRLILLRIGEGEVHQRLDGDVLAGELLRVEIGGVGGGGAVGEVAQDLGEVGGGQVEHVGGVGGGGGAGDVDLVEERLQTVHAVAPAVLPEGG